MKKLYGDHPTITGERQVSQIPSTKAAMPAIETDRWYRNGKHPDAKAMNLMNAAMNAAMLFRTKTAFEFTGYIGTSSGHILSSSAGTRDVWRVAFHTSPYTHALLVRAMLYPQKNGFEYDSYTTLKIYSDATESTLVTETEFHYGPNPLQAAASSGWQHLNVVDKFVEGLTADTDYYALISNVDYGLCTSIVAADMQSMSENYSGYLPVNFTEETQILDKYRENIVTAIPPMWKRGAAKILNWSVLQQSSPQTITSATPTNLIDGTSTTYGASIPGYQLDMTGKARLSQSTGVPFRMVVCGSSTTDGKGRVYLKDSAGTTICSITDSWSTGTPVWQTVTGVLPASDQKVYLVYDDNSSTGTLSIYAASLYEYEA